MKQKIKEWWIAILGSTVVILDLGFDVVNPILTNIDVPLWFLNTVKVVFAIYGIYRLLKQKTPKLLLKQEDDDVVGSRPGDR